MSYESHWLEIIARELGDSNAMQTTLRDQFAMKCLGSVSHPHLSPMHAEETAKVCYRMADAMLAARDLPEDES